MPRYDSSPARQGPAWCTAQRRPLNRWEDMAHMLRSDQCNCGRRPVMSSVQYIKTATMKDKGRGDVTDLGRVSVSDKGDIVMCAVERLLFHPGRVPLTHAEKGYMGRYRKNILRRVETRPRIKLIWTGEAHGCFSSR